jgi:putative glutamine amidotransferase
MDRMALKAGVSFRVPAKVEPYLAALRLAGIEPAPITPEDAPSLTGLSGVVITGGTDPNPALYGQEPCSQTDGPDDERDELEIGLLHSALSAGLPVLAICRGLELLNVVHGGTLVQHLEPERGHRQIPGPDESSGHHRPAHAILVSQNSLLGSIMGAGEHEVNSRHHQAVDKLGDELVVSARSADGIVEAVERPNLPFAIGVQWHPEDRIFVSDADKRLFLAFAEALRPPRR